MGIVKDDFRRQSLVRKAKAVGVDAQEKPIANMLFFSKPSSMVLHRETSLWCKEAAKGGP